jgi:protein TonB
MQTGNPTAAVPRRGRRQDRSGSHAPLVAGCLTMGLFLALPYVHVVEPPDKAPLELITIERTDWQAPPLPHPEREAQPQEAEPLPKPKLVAPRPHVAPLQAVLDFDVGLADIGGDFDINFAMDTMGDTGLDSGGIFELSELDQSPQPLVQLRPLYPTHARMRQIEGSVEVEFVVFPDGRAGEVTVLASEPGTVFKAAAVRAIERWRFSPGIRDGSPVPVRIRQRIRFQLER